MAPIDNKVDHDVVEQQLKDIIQDLYQIMVQVSTYDSMGRPSKDVLSNEIKTLSRSLNTLHTTAAPPHVLPSVPPELLEYVENGRNPDIYTREFVELVRRGNQLMAGKMRGFAALRDVLAHNVAAAMPELRDDVARVIEATTTTTTTATAVAVAAGAHTTAGVPAAVNGTAPQGGAAASSNGEQMATATATATATVDGARTTAG